jgi:hypothetical protein
VAFLDSILQMKVFEDYSRGLFIPTFFHKLTLDPMQHAINVQELEAKNEDIGEMKHSSFNQLLHCCLSSFVT